MRLITPLSIKSIKTQDELETIMKTNKPVLCLFSASWCAPCQKLHPIIEEIRLQTKTLAAGNVDKEKLLEDIAWVTVDVDQSEDLCAHYNIQSIPHLHLFINGKRHSNIVGPTKEQVVDLVMASYGNE